MVTRLVITLIKLYQVCLSPLTGSACRFTPSCSAYAVQAFEAHGFFKGLALTAVRILKCHPFHPGGDDPVPKT